MMRTMVIGLLLGLAPLPAALTRDGALRGTGPAELAAQRYPVPPGAYGRAGYGGARASVWVDDQREYLRRGDRLRVNFSTSADAFVAVVHIDPEGRMDFLFPESPWDEAYVRGGEVYQLPYRGGLGRGSLIRGRGGIGYLYIIASPVPLAYELFAPRGGYGWDWSYGGQFVRGDPFWALEQLTRVLVPDWGYVPFTVDYHSYYVEGPHRYPAYACAGGVGRSGWGWGYGGGYNTSVLCDRMDWFLDQNPYYFDAGRYRGDRRAYFRGYRGPEVRHQYKESPEREWTGSGDGTGQRYAPAAGGARPVPPAERRPTLERRSPERGTARGVTPARRAPAVQRAPSAPSGGDSKGGQRTAQPRRRAPDN